MDPSSPGPDFARILAALARCHVDFVIVGGVGAVLQGAPANTFDLDIVHSRDEANVQRLLNALRELEAVYRLQPERELKPDVSHRRSAGHQLLMTKFGPLDLLGAIGHARTFEDLKPRSVALELGPGLVAYVASLADIIASKEEAGAAKDAGTLPVLRRTLLEKRNTEPEDEE